MTRRAAVAAALVVLSLLVGSRWVTQRSSVLAAQAAPAPTTRTASPTPYVAPPTQAPPPTPPPTTAAAPKPPPAKRVGNGPFGSMKRTGRKQVALTFDDGPHPVWTPKVLDRLKAAHVKATFCLIGSQAAKYPELVKRIVREGHTLCNHSWNHELDLGKRPVKEIRANLERTNRAILKAVPGAKIKYFRHPGGEWTANAVQVSESMGMLPLDWDVDPRDWEISDAKEIGSRIIGHARPGSIILMHDGGGDRAGTLTACPTVIKTLKGRYGITQLR